jgi:hypothetical protein
MKKFFTIEDEIFINQFTQKINNLDEMNKWFFSHYLEEKRNIVKLLINLVIQAHPTYDEIKESADLLQKSSSPSAIKLLNKNKPFNKFGHELSNLPEKELLNAFDILLLTLSSADNRRKEEEDPENCNHWWHKDLSNNEYLDSLIKLYSKSYS